MVSGPKIVDAKTNDIRCNIDVLIHTEHVDELRLYTRQPGGKWSFCDSVDNVEGHVQLTDDENPSWGIYEYVAVGSRDGLVVESDLFEFDAGRLLNIGIGALLSDHAEGEPSPWMEKP